MTERLARAARVGNALPAELADKAMLNFEAFTKRWAVDGVSTGRHCPLRLVSLRCLSTDAVPRSGATLAEAVATVGAMPEPHWQEGRE